MTTVSVKENVVDFELGLWGFTAYRCVSFHMNHILHEILYLALGDFCWMVYGELPFTDVHPHLYHT